MGRDFEVGEVEFRFECGGGGGGRGELDWGGGIDCDMNLNLGMSGNNGCANARGGGCDDLVLLGR